MNIYKLVVAYDGTAYQGWQVQATGATLAGTMQRVFTTVFKKEVTLLGASRTDAGVHALGQIVRVRTPLVLPAVQLREAWNNRLPGDILIRAAEQLPHFHPHHDVAQKTYWYHLFLRRPLPQVARYGWFAPMITEHVDWALFLETMQAFVGTHDFAAFSRVESADKDTVRTIDCVTVTPLQRYGVVRIAISGNSFLHYQIRRMIGAALRVTPRSKNLQARIGELLKTPGPSPELSLKVPSQGLCLRSIEYRKEGM